MSVVKIGQVTVLLGFTMSLTLLLFEAKPEKNMFIYNITFNVEEDIEKDWLHWMKDVHIPEILASDKFVGHRILRIIDVQAETGVSYAVQFEAKSLKNIQHYVSRHAPDLQKKTYDRYGQKIVAFRTVMEEMSKS